MQGYGLVLLAVAVGLLAGGLLGTQPSVNGQLARSLQHPLQATFISFASGTAIIMTLMIVSRSFPPSFTKPPGELPWWSWGGGFIGVVVVTTSLLLVPRVGSLPWFGALMTGQMLAALFLDHYGLLRNPKASMSPLRVTGSILLILGVLLIVQAKRFESAKHEEPSNLGDQAIGDDMNSQRSLSGK